MAMSLKKIGAIAVGGAMVASALASGVMAATTSGDVAGFMKNAIKEDGTPNVDIVVGSGAAVMDVVSAADVAAKIGSMAYKTGDVEDGSAVVKVSAKAESDDVNIFTLNDTNEDIALVAAADSDYAKGFIDSGKLNVKGELASDSIQDENDSDFTATSLDDVSTMLKVTDIDPSDWYSNDDDAGEVVFTRIVYDSDKLSIDEDQILYASIAYKNDEEVFNNANTVTLKPGMRIPFLGEEYAVVKIDADDDIIYLGKEAKDGNLKEGETFAVGNGYEVKIASILKSGSEYKATVQILKDGKVVEEKPDTVSNTTQLTLAYKDVGVVVNDAWEDIAGTTGYAEVLITKDTKPLELGEEYIPDWEAWAALNDNGKLDIKKEINETDKANVVGIALKYVGDKKKKLDDGDEVDIANYLKLVFDDEDKNNVLKVKFLMDESKERTLDIDQKATVLNAEVRLKDIKADAQQSVKLTAPIAKLDSEVSLDTADKNLILVGGPVVNALTKELVDTGEVAIDNESPAMLVAVPDAANGNDVLVVAGGDRDKTRKAAKDLLEMI